MDGEFERLCVLYNIGALMSQIGSEANLQTDDGLKIAAKYFQVIKLHVNVFCLPFQKQCGKSFMSWRCERRNHKLTVILFVFA